MSLHGHKKTSTARGLTYPAPPLPPPPLKRTPQARRARSTPETLSPEHAEELVQTASNGHTKAGATPPQSLPLCHAEERTTPGQQRLWLQGSEHHLSAKCPRCPGFGARDVRPPCPRHVIILTSIALYNALASSQLHQPGPHKGRDLTGY